MGRKGKEKGKLETSNCERGRREEELGRRKRKEKSRNRGREGEKIKEKMVTKNLSRTGN